MEAISGKKPLVKYWLHAGFLTVKGQKMAKSLGNFITIQDFLKSYPARVLRFFVLKSHYRSPIDYNEKLVIQIQKEIEKIDEFVGKLQPRISTNSIREYSRINIRTYSRAFVVAMENDFNVPAALALVFRLINRGNQLLNKGKLTPADARDILEFLKKIDKIFNFIFWGKPKKERIPEGILKLVQEREKYRKSGNYKKADEIRMRTKQKSYWIEDTKEGPKIKKLKH